jgi:hypothetical protein
MDVEMPGGLGDLGGTPLLWPSMWQIALALVSGDVRYVPLRGKTDVEAQAALRDFASEQGDYRRPWLETTDGRFVQRSQVVEAWLYEDLPVIEE